MIQTIDNASARAELFNAKEINRDEQLFLASPHIVARFESKDCRPNKQGEFEIGIGLVGCPGNTHQVVFFTDDEDFVDDDNLEESLCLVTRSSPVRSVFWASEPWHASGDHRIFACGVSADGEHFATASHLTDAILYFIEYAKKKANFKPDAKLANAIASLKRSDGSDLDELIVRAQRAGSAKRRH
jgi:hypothetical protein